jgi:transcription elongation factor Elf1
VEESIQTQLLRSDFEFECPRCGYINWARMSEVVVQTTVRCPCCRISIRLIDERASGANAGNVIEAMVEDALRQAFRG